MKSAEKTQNFATRLHSCRKLQLLTQEELAEKAQVSLRSVQVWEKAGGIPGPNNLRSLAAVLRVPVSYLLKGAAIADPVPPSVAPVGYHVAAPGSPVWACELITRLEQMPDEARSRTLRAMHLILDAVLIGSATPAVSHSSPTNQARAAAVAAEANQQTKAAIQAVLQGTHRPKGGVARTDTPARPRSSESHPAKT